MSSQDEKPARKDKAPKPARGPISKRSSRFIEQLNKRLPPPQPSTRTDSVVEVTASGPQTPQATGRSRAGSHASTRQALIRHQVEQTRESVLSLLAGYESGFETAANGLASIAQKYGIIPELRQKVWPILLETHPLVKLSNERDTKRSVDLFRERTEVPTKKIYDEIAHYRRREKNSPFTRSTTPPRSLVSSNTSLKSPAGYPSPPLEALDDEAIDEMATNEAVKSAIVSFLEGHPTIKYADRMVHVCFTLADWLLPLPNAACLSQDDHVKNAAQLNRAFCQMMHIMTWSPSIQDGKEAQLDGGVTRRRINHFLDLLGKSLPELSMYMRTEAMTEPSENWLNMWLQWWCVRELKRPQKARLWDFYLGYRPSIHKSAEAPVQRLDGDGEQDAPLRSKTPDKDDLEQYTPADWHPYVCLALLKSAKDQMQELDWDEMRSFLTKPPQVEMQIVLREAEVFREEHKEYRIQELLKRNG
ncbi:MAG: hypothetical protein M1814_000344 [Vezdaea aestivalis]|nr:MAG: hypothetical protein M1814_000344 [Vezdaea aestivalis]